MLRYLLSFLLLTAAAQAATVPLTPGWNPVAFEGTRVTSVSGPTVVGLVTYDGTTYRPVGLDPASLNEGEGPGRGFWAYAREAGTLTYEAEQGTRPTLRALLAGWNLVAFPPGVDTLRPARGTLLIYRIDSNGNTTLVTSPVAGRPHWVYCATATEVAWGSTPTPSPTATPASDYWVDYHTIPRQLKPWTLDSGIRSTGGTVAPTILVLPDGRLRLFYPATGGMGSAISSDGLNFTIEPGSRGRFVGDIGVIYLKGGGYRIVFPQGVNGSQTLGSAVSSDGYNFTVEPGARFTPTAQDAGLCQVPHVLRLPDGRWRLYYIGDWMGTGGSLYKDSIRTAVSSDEGLTFTSERQGDLFPSHWVDPDMKYLEGGGYRLYMRSGVRSLSHADSTDGLATDFQAISDLEGEERFDPFVIKLKDGTVRMFWGLLNQGIVSASTTSSTSR